MKNRDLVRMAMYLAIFAVLDFIAKTTGIFDMPQGGSLGLATIALVIASFDFGVKKAFLLAMVSIVIQTFVAGAPIFIAWPQFFLDYIFAFGVYAFAVSFPLYKGDGFWWISGIIIVNLIRFVLHVISGILYFEAPLVASVAYNGPYMLATTIVTFVIVGGVLPRLNLPDKPN